MWAVLEGPDSSGKSSLAEAIAQRLAKTREDEPVAVHHKGVPTRSLLEEYCYDYEAFRAGEGNIVSDRHHLGDPVYGPIYRKTGELGEFSLASFRWCEMFLLARGARTFFIDQPAYLLEERLRERGDDYVDIKDVVRIRERYLALEKTCATSSGVLMPEGDTTEIEEHVIEACLAYSFFSEWTAQVPSYVGHTQPRVILVGEKRGGPPPYVTHGAFMPTQRGNSGSYLLEALPDPFWRSIGLMNGLEDDPGLVAASVPTTKFVALGQKAHRVLEKGGLAHATVPHPQRVKRFAHKMKTEYGQLIQSAAGTTEDRLSWPN